MLVKLNICILLITLHVVCGKGEYYTPISSKLDQVIYMYPKQIRNEQELSTCKPKSVCSVVNKRFWLPSLVYRLCRCQNSQCPFTWSKTDDHSNMLDNRSQLKTCNKMSYMEACQEREIGLTVTEREGRKSRGQKKRDINLLCKCDWPAYWKLNTHIQNATYVHSEYTCVQLSKCQSGDFCGHIRADTYSAYYQCSCPRNHLCINEDKVMRNVTELLYHGPMFRGFCTPSPHREGLNELEANI